MFFQLRCHVQTQTYTVVIICEACPLVPLLLENRHWYAGFFYSYFNGLCVEFWEISFVLLTLEIFVTKKNPNENDSLPHFTAN